MNNIQPQLVSFAITRKQRDDEPMLPLNTLSRSGRQVNDHEADVSQATHNNQTGPSRFPVARLNRTYGVGLKRVDILRGTDGKKVESSGTAGAHLDPRLLQSATGAEFPMGTKPYEDLEEKCRILEKRNAKLKSKLVDQSVLEKKYAELISRLIPQSALVEANANLALEILNQEADRRALQKQVQDLSRTLQQLQAIRQDIHAPEKSYQVPGLNLVFRNTNNLNAEMFDIQSPLVSQPKEPTQSRDHRKHRYQRVKALLVNWGSDDLGVHREQIILEHLLRHCFNFEVSTYLIPDTDSLSALHRRVREFIGDNSPETLLIFAYSGHGILMAGSRDLEWVANNTENSPYLNSTYIQALLEKSKSDALLLYDACLSTTSFVTKPTGKQGSTELIAACGFEHVAGGVGGGSYTNALTEELSHVAANDRVVTIPELHRHILDRLRNHSVETRAGKATPVYVSLTSRASGRPIFLRQHRSSNPPAIPLTVPLADAAGSSRKKVEYLGKQYDHVFNIIFDKYEYGPPPLKTRQITKCVLKLPYNASQNIHKTCAKFLYENKIPIWQLDILANFCIAQVGVENLPNNADRMVVKV